MTRELMAVILTVIIMGVSGTAAADDLKNAFTTNIATFINGIPMIEYERKTSERQSIGLFFGKSAFEGAFGVEHDLLIVGFATKTYPGRNFLRGGWAGFSLYYLAGDIWAKDDTGGITNYIYDRREFFAELRGGYSWVKNTLVIAPELLIDMRVAYANPIDGEKKAGEIDRRPSAFSIGIGFRLGYCW